MTSYEEFLSLHVPGRPFVLANAWDVYSALAFVDAGHAAIGTTSLGITAAAGVLDGSRLGHDLTVELVGRLRGRLAVPLTVDLEDGYHDDPSAVCHVVATVAEFGAVGINLEDAGRSTDEQQKILAAVRRNIEGVFINARLDEFWSGEHNLRRALERCRAYRDAGADGLFLPGLTDPGAIDEVAAVGPPLNLLWHSGLDLHNTPAARVSTGSAPFRSAIAAGVAAVQAARTGGTPPPAVSYAATQTVLGPRASH